MTQALPGIPPSQSENERRLVSLCSQPAADALAALSTTPRGLTSEEAERRLTEVGPNELSRGKHLGFWADILQRCRSPLVVQLLIIAIVSGLIGQLESTAIVGAMILLSVGLSYVLDRRSGRAVESLGKRVQSRTLVLRDGQETEIRISEVVPGDVVILHSGSIIPADLRLLAVKDFFVSQSALSGESMAVEKSAEARPAPDQAVADVANACFLGTNVTSGTARGVVVNTGTRTLFGAIAGAPDRASGRDQLRPGRAVVHVADDPLHDRDGLRGVPHRRAHQGQLAGGAPVRAVDRRRPHARDAADDRHGEPGQGGADDGREEGHRQTTPRHPEPRRDRHSLHRQDRDADPGRRGARTARRHHRPGEPGRAELRLPEQLLPDGPAEPHRPGGARAGRPGRGARLPPGGRAAVRFPASPDVGRGRLRGRPRADLQGRRRGDLLLLQPLPGRRRGLRAARGDSRGSVRGGRGAQQPGLPRPRHRVPGVPPRADDFHDRRREPAGAAGVHRLLRSAEGLGGLGAEAPLRGRREGEGPDRRQRSGDQEGVPGRGACPSSAWSAAPSWPGSRPSS